ncbi:MAG: class II glutamine amidotransferase [Hyphomicrobiales bacterium]|nr:class II glutamine amidotransferase [Alphaproteobacteria bacterium]
MCRWIAYTGGPVYLEELLFKPKHSLIDQSLAARSGATTTNGDGFGVGWYGSGTAPGLYKGVQPAWSDDNLLDLASQIKTPMFMAHVRATTGTAVQRTNCHPFRYDNWLFQHNGAIREFKRVKRDLILAISPALFSEISGSTDSEIMFYLALTFGLRADPIGGVERMIGFIESVGKKHSVPHPLQMTLAILDGRTLYAFRYSSERNSRTLFHSADAATLRQRFPSVSHFSDDTRAVVSEPLGAIENAGEAWVEIPEASAVTISAGKVKIVGLQPHAP